MFTIRHILILFIFLTIGCNEDKQIYTVKDHSNLKADIPFNYQNNQDVFQALAKEVSSFKLIRSMEFLGGKGMIGPIRVYCATIGRDSGYTIGVNQIKDPLSDSGLQAVLRKEGISQSAITTIKRRLDQVNCNSFFSFQTVNINTGTPYIHIEFRYNDWDGVHRYYYKLFDKKLEQDMVRFFDRKNTQLGNYYNLGTVLDTNAVWLMPTD